MKRRQFIAAVEKLGLTTDGSHVDAPEHQQFALNGTHCLAVTGTYEEMLAQVRQELLVTCPKDCDCRELPLHLKTVDNKPVWF